MNNKNTVPMKPALLKIEQLRPFEGHPYKVQDNEEMAALSESIRENGVLSPLVVRSVESSNEYEVISGHRRLYAARKAGLTEVPVLICTLDRDAAAIALVDSNLHREHILPSEKAYAYKLKMKALSHQGIACGQVGHKSRDDISDTDSGRQVQRYIRLTYLIPELPEKMDKEEIASRLSSVENRSSTDASSTFFRAAFQVSSPPASDFCSFQPPCRRGHGRKCSCPRR